MVCGVCQTRPTAERSRGWRLVEKPSLMWLCGCCDVNQLTPQAAGGMITGEGYDQERYRALWNEDCKAVLELGGTDVKAWPGAVFVGKVGGRPTWAPHPESLNSLQKRREFYKCFPRFEDH